MTHASVFSGIGGPEVAAAMLGWDNLFHCEINPFGRKVLNYWFPNSKSYEDITKTDFSEWRGRVDVLTGGFPCQPFSYAGKRRGADDDRYLWPYIFKAIDQIRPTWVVAENVAGITTMVEQGEVVEVGCQASLFEEVDGIHRYILAETFTLQRICSDLESHGYSVQPVLIPAGAVGAPHRRDRVFIVARRRDSPDTSQSRVEGLRREQQDAIHRPRYAADTAGEQGGRCEPGKPRYGKPQQVELGGRGGEDAAKRNAADTYGQRPDKPVFASEPSETQRFNCEENHTSGIAGLGRWDSYPSVSPVHRGNNGIPFDVDRLSIPFSKWRTESLKAYGNAIVPQVMYEIFRAIDIITNNKAMKENQIVLPPDANGGVSITPPQGCEVDKVEVVDGILTVTFKPQERLLPRTWEEFCKMYLIKPSEFYITDFSEVADRTEVGDVRDIKEDKNMLPDRITAEAVLALCQLIQLRNCYNGDWVPDWKNKDEIKHIIKFDAEEIQCDTWIGMCASSLYFKTAELRDEFLRNFRPLIEKLQPLYGIKEGGGDEARL